MAHTHLFNGFAEARRQAAMQREERERREEEERRLEEEPKTLTEELCPKPCPNIMRPCGARKEVVRLILVKLTSWSQTVA